MRTQSIYESNWHRKRKYRRIHQRIVLEEIPPLELVGVVKGTRKRRRD